MAEQRENSRYRSSAKAIIKGFDGEEAEVKDISISGCRLELANYAAIEPKKQYELRIIPEIEAKIEYFFLTAESIWVGTMVNSFEFGFSIIKSPKGKQFQRYVDYLAWRYSKGNSMTGSDSPEIAPML
jgi:hypothetical protein